jgi:hypothetical protein
MTTRNTAVMVVAGLATAALISSVTADEKSTARPTGGRAVAHRNGHAAPAPGNVPVARTSGLDHQAGEPTLGLTPAGDIFVATGSFNWYGVAGVGMTPDILRSTDKGKTWDVVSPRVLDQNMTATSLDPYVLVDEVDGDAARIFTIDLTVACSYMSFTDDDGESWITNPLACGRPVNDHQTLFAGPPVSSPTVGYPNIVYYCWNDVASSSCTKSLDGGISFSPTGQPAFFGYPPDEGSDGDLCGGLHGHGVVGNDGTVYLPREYCGKPYLAISHDEGVSWTRVVVGNVKKGVPAGGGDPSVAVDAKGNLYYTWASAKDRLPYLSVSEDGGETWTDPVMVGTPAIKESNFPTITVGAPGKIAIAYYGSTNSLYQECRKDDNGCDGADYAETTWNGYLAQSTNALDANPLLFTGTINDPEDPLIVRGCGPGRCGSVWDFIDVEIGPDGIPYGVYVDGCMTKECKTRGSGPYPGHVHEGLVGMLIGGPRLR